MVLMLARKFMLPKQIIDTYSRRLVWTSALQKTAICSLNSHELSVNQSSRWFQLLSVFSKPHWFMNFQYLSTGTQLKSLCWEGSSHAVLLRKLEVSLKDHKVDEAWVTYNDFKNLYGFPTESLVSRLITELSYSLNPYWLQKACKLVFQILEEKSNLLRTEILTKLSLSLARAQMPISVSMVLRVILEQKNMPPLTVLRLIFHHMVKTDIGACLAYNILIQICDCFLYQSAKRANKEKIIKPDTLIFNLVLDACVRFKSSPKGLMLIDLMSRTGVLADAQSIIIIAQIYEMNSLRDEINKFKDHIYLVSAPFIRHFQQFYDCLFSINFNLDDIDAATELVLEMNRSQGYIRHKNASGNMNKPCLVSIGSQNLRDGLKLQIIPELLQKDSIMEVEYRKEHIIFEHGKLLLTNRAVAKLINGYKRHGRIAELSNLVLSMQKDFVTLSGLNLCSDAIDACICLGWLDTAHDILDDMEAAGFRVGLCTYTRLLTAYYSKEMFREGEALQRQIRNTELSANLYDKIVPSVSKSDLTDELVRVTREEMAGPRVHELNSSIYFFCRAKMMEDALKTYRRMQVQGIKPTVLTFVYLISGYSSLEMYRDITILWGDIKRNIKDHNFVASRDLYELLLLNFIRGGYFERVMEVVGYMKQDNLYIDKWIYKSEFLKLHKNLYKGLKVSETRNETQRKRLEFVRTFQKWVGID